MSTNTILNSVLFPVIIALATTSVALLSTHFWEGVVCAVLTLAFSYVYEILP